MGLDHANASPADAAKTISQIAEALGLDDDASHDEINAALDSAFALVTGGDGSPSSNDTATNSRTLSANELRICKEVGCTPAVFKRLKYGGR